MQGPREPRLLHGYLRDTARRAAGCTAIEEDSRVTSFGQLFEKSACLSAALVASGLQKGERVALLLDKTTDAITCLFATLMAGAVYVPIQPRWPAKGVEATLEDCAAHFAVAPPGSALAARYGSPSGRADSSPVIVDLVAGTQISLENALEARAPAFPEPDFQPSDPALILFTSGSTGRPKGVVLSHRAVGAFVKWSAAEFQISSSDRIACPSPLSFDLSTLDIFNMALRGATCVIVPEAIVWMPRFLARFLREQRITAWYSVPSMLASMLSEPEFVRCGYPDLRLVLFAGEVFSSHSIAKLQAAIPHASCYNLYGPTETNVVSYYQVGPDFDTTRPVPIGKACPYAELVLDPSGIESQNGTRTGELLAGGESMMTGYWNRPKETEQAFIMACGAGGRPERFYKTGDRVSLDDSGNYTFIGRLDRQVKRRGFRIELGEIEAALGRHADVREVAAIFSKDQELGTRITAFVRRRPHSTILQVEMKMHCAQFMPSYMVPDQIVFVERIPRGSRGKIDYAALRELHERRRENGD